MNDFDEKFKQRETEFDRDWKQARTWAWATSVAVIIFTLSIMGFIGWVIVKLMQFFGVI